MPNTIDEPARTHYAPLVRAAMPARVEPTQQQPPQPHADPAVPRVESGNVLAALVTTGTLPPLEVPLPPPGDAAAAVVVDAAGHARPHYPGLMCYCWSRAIASLGTPWPHEQRGIRAWTDVFRRRLAARDTGDRAHDAARGARVTADAWDALALASSAEWSGDAAGHAQAAEVFRALADRQTPAGPFLRAATSDNPEAFWFHELVLLHAVTSYAFLTGDTAAAAAARRHAEWVQAETQPDHATGEPWAVHAFILNPSTRPLADGLLHAVRVLHPGGASGVSLMLLADALYCLRAAPGRP